MTKIKHPKPTNRWFCIAFPSPDGSKLDIIESKKRVDFIDPETNEEYSAIIEDMFWYPISFISNAVAKMALQTTATELKTELMRKYRYLKEDSEISIVLFKQL
jgi:hypothetical protein